MAHAVEARSRLPAGGVRSQLLSRVPEAGPWAALRHTTPRVRWNIQYSTTVGSGTAPPWRRYQEVGQMPAVTVDDLTTLARLSEPGLGDQPRPVLQVTTAPS